MSETDKAMLLSVHPRYAEAILDGTKTAEIRRRAPRLDPGSLLILYATAPTAAIIGTARITQIRTGDPKEAWTWCHRRADLTREEFDQYLTGAASATVLFLDQPQRLTVPIDLTDIRAVAPFQPPQSFRYMDKSAIRQTFNGSAGTAHLLRRLDDTDPARS